MTEEEVKQCAQSALDYMRKHRFDDVVGLAHGFGYAWSALARIAGTPDLPLPERELNDGVIK